MARPAGGYKNAAGEKLPGVTTIVGRFTEKGALMVWAYRQGEDPNVNSLYEKRDEAAEAGTIGHWLVEQRIDTPDADFSISELMAQHKATTEVVKQGMSAFQSYLTWEKSSNLVVVAQEMSLVSEQYQYGGTPDAVGYVNDQLCLVDWKTSNAIYRDYLLQLAAYKQLWEENNPLAPITGGFHICRFAKEHGDFEHRHFPKLDEAWECFKHLRAAYALDLKLKKRCT